MNIKKFSFFVKKILIILVCLGITDTSLASKHYKCQVVGTLLLRRNVQRENNFDSSAIDIIRSPKILNRVLQELDLSNLSSG